MYGAKKRFGRKQALRAAENAALSGVSAASSGDGGVSLSEPAVADGALPPKSARGPRARLEVARLADENVTLSEDVTRLAAGMEAHRRFATRATSATLSTEAKLAECEAKLEAARQETKQVQDKCGQQVAAVEHQLERVKKQLEMTQRSKMQLQRNVSEQIGNVRRLEAQLRAAKRDGDTHNAEGRRESSGVPRESTITRSQSGCRPGQMSEIALPSTRSPGRRPDSSGAHGSTTVVRVAAARKTEEELRVETFELRKRVRDLESELQAADAAVKDARATSEARLAELQLKDKQLDALRDQLPSAPAGAPVSRTHAAEDEGFEELLAEELASMRAEYEKRLEKEAQNVNDVSSKLAKANSEHERERAEWKSRLLEYQLQVERMQRVAGGDRDA